MTFQYLMWLPIPQNQSTLLFLEIPKMTSRVLKMTSGVHQMASGVPDMAPKVPIMAPKVPDMGSQVPKMGFRLPKMDPDHQNGFPFYKNSSSTRITQSKMAS